MNCYHAEQCVWLARFGTDTCLRMFRYGRCRPKGEDETMSTGLSGEWEGGDSPCGEQKLRVAKGEKMPCFRCKINGSIVCEGHCGACACGEEDDGPYPDMDKPSERMFDGRPWIPGE